MANGVDVQPGRLFDFRLSLVILWRGGRADRDVFDGHRIVLCDLPWVRRMDLQIRLADPLMSVTCMSRKSVVLYRPLFERAVAFKCP